MSRSIMLAAAAAALFALAAPAPAQARMYNPALNEVAPANLLVQDVHYRRYRHSHRYQRRHHRHGYYQPARYRHCSNQRVRVFIPGGRIVFRTQRRCGWRYR